MADYDVLSAACEQNCKKQGLQFFESFFTKIVQLCEFHAYCSMPAICAVQWNLLYLLAALLQGRYRLISVQIRDDRCAAWPGVWSHPVSCL